MHIFTVLAAFLEQLCYRSKNRSAERRYRWALQLGIDHITPYVHENYNSGELI